MKQTWITVSVGLVMMLGAFVAGQGQAMPTAVRPITTEAGIGFSYARPDIGPAYVKGFTAFGNAMVHNRFGLEVDLHFLNLFTPDNVGENMFEVGPVVSLIHEDRMNLYVKAVGGIGRVDFKTPTFSNPHTETYGIYGIGGGIEFRASQRINIRAVEIE
ncbi:MAG TPA: hypothetical protein VGN16_17630 [Acidobacteriaceae bacterium]